MNQSTTETANVLLEQKVKKEYQDFLRVLEDLPIPEIIERAREKVYKEEILLALSDCNLREENAKALYNEENTLSAIYEVWTNISNPKIEYLPDLIKYKSNVLLLKEAEKKMDQSLTGEKVITPRGIFSVTAMSKEEVEAAGYGQYYDTEDGEYHIMTNGTKALAVAVDQPMFNAKEFNSKQDRLNSNFKDHNQTFLKEDKFEI